MRSRIQILPSLLCLCGLSLWPAGLARGQSADEFFHGGAQSYITNNVQNARTLVDAGMKLYPTDEKLKKLDELLKQQQQQQQQDQNQQQQQNQKDQQDQKNQQNQKKNNQNQQQGKDDPQKQDKQKQDPSKQQPKDQNQDKKDQKDKQDQQPKPGEDKKDGEPQPASAAQAKPMTPEEAKRLLDGQKGDEKVLLMQPTGKEKPDNPDHPHKDW